MKIRIVAKSPNLQRAKGQDTRVVLVQDDGVEVLLPDVSAVSWKVDGRAGYCTATLVISGVEIDADASLSDDAAAALETIVRLRRSGLSNP